MYLRCSAGTVEWLYPTGALIVNLRPNTFAPSRPLTLCIQPLPDSSGANIYLEKTGELQLLVRDGDTGRGRARCFGLERGGLFVEATPQRDLGRRAAGFAYELSGRRPGRGLHAAAGEWPEPCPRGTDPPSTQHSLCRRPLALRGRQALLLCHTRGSPLLSVHTGGSAMRVRLREV